MDPDTRTVNAQWRKASPSNSTGDACVEVAALVETPTQEAVSR